MVEPDLVLRAVELVLLWVAGEEEEEEEGIRLVWLHGDHAEVPELLDDGPAEGDVEDEPLRPVWVALCCWGL